MRMGGSNGGSDSCPDQHSGDREDGICDSLTNKQHTYLRGRSDIRCFDSLIWLFVFDNLCKIWSRLNHDQHSGDIDQHQDQLRTVTCVASESSLVLEPYDSGLWYWILNWNSNSGLLALKKRKPSLRPCSTTLMKQERLDGVATELIC
jgi:hypothetical protein